MNMAKINACKSDVIELTVALILFINLIDFLFLNVNSTPDFHFTYRFSFSGSFYPSEPHIASIGNDCLNIRIIKISHQF